MTDTSPAGGGGTLPRQSMDAAAYERRAREGPCFVCEVLAGNPAYPGEMVYADEDHVAFLASYNTLLGHTLAAWHVAPLPPGVPYEEQQLAAFSWDRGVLDLPEADRATLGRRISARVAALRRAAPSVG